MFRIYPVVPLNARLLSENDVIIGGHFFPKKVLFFPLTVLFLIFIILPKALFN